MKKFLWLIVLGCLLFTCDKEGEEELTQEEEIENLQEMAVEMFSLSSSVPCDNLDEWSFVGYGDKPCGGYWGFVAYHESIESQFLTLVAALTQAEEDYNEKWGPGSDCSVPSYPSGIVCENGDAVFTY